jgi:tetratricopeptide (TPR) repeat protein
MEDGGSTLTPRASGGDGSSELVSTSRTLLDEGKALFEDGHPVQAFAVWDGIVERCGAAVDPEARRCAARALVAKAYVLAQLKRDDEAIAVYQDLDARFGGGGESWGVTAPVARGLVDLAAALGRLDRQDERLETYDMLIARYGASEDTGTREQVANALFAKGRELVNLGRRDEALAAYDELDERFSDAGEPEELAKWFAAGRLGRGRALNDAGRYEEAIQTYDALAAQYAESPDPKVRQWVAQALFNKAVSVKNSRSVEEVVAALVELDTRFGGADEPEGVMAVVRKGLVYRAGALRQLNRREEELEICDDLLRRFGASTVPEVRGLIAQALVSKAEALRVLEGDEAAVVAYVDLDARFGVADEPPEVQRQVAWGLMNRASALDRLGHYEDKINLYDGLVSRFGSSNDPYIRSRAAAALVNKALTLKRLKGDEAAIVAYEDLDARFGGADEPPTVQTEVSRGLMNRALAFDRLGRHEEEIDVYDELAGRFGNSDDPDIRGRVAMALYNKALTLVDLGRYEESGLVFEDLDVRFGGADESPAVQTQVAKGLIGRAVGFDRLGQHDEEIDVYDVVVSRFGSSEELATLKQVVKALRLKAITLRTLKRQDQALAAYDELLDRFSSSSDSFFVTAVVTTLERKGRTLRRLGRVDEALSAFDRAAESASALDPAQQTDLLVEILLEKAIALNAADRQAEAVILFDSSVETYRDAVRDGLPVTGKSTETIALALLFKIGVLAELGREAEISSIPEQFEKVLGSEGEQATELRAGTPSPPDPELAALLAETHAGDCWFWMATAESDTKTRTLMSDRATDLYSRTERWLSPDPERWEEPSFLAVMALRTIADGYALLSNPSNGDDRSNLPLPTLPLFERGLRIAGLDEWAADQGHPLDLRESDEAVEAMVDEQREKMEQLLDADNGDLERKLALAFVVAACNYRIMRTFTRFAHGTEYASSDRLRAFTVTGLSPARTWSAWAGEFLEDAAGVAVAMVLMAESSFLLSHLSESADVAGFPDPATLRVFLEESDAFEWLQAQHVEVPHWLSADEQA